MAEDNELQILLEGSAHKLGIKLDAFETEKFILFKDILKQWNEKINITAIEDDREIIIKHFIDSLSIVPIVVTEILKCKNKGIPGKSIRMIDIGTGGGFPGIPVKIILEEINITLFDSLDKRIKFLNEAIKLLNLKGINCLHGRAEEFGIKPDYREKFNIVTARAVANLPVLLEYCLPFVKQGGLFIAMKGSNMDEVNASKNALDELGGCIEEVKELTLPSSDIKRNIILVRKLRQTPTKYPRKAGKPSKEPLL